MWLIDAVHPIFKRVLKHKLNGNEMIDLYEELRDAGYEAENITLKCTSNRIDSIEAWSVDEWYDFLMDFAPGFRNLSMDERGEFCISCSKSFDKKWEEALEEAIEYADNNLPKKFALVDGSDWCDWYMDQLEYLKENFTLIKGKEIK